MKRSTIIVLLLALALGGYVYFYEMKSGKDRDAEEQTKPAFTFKPEAAKTLSITHKGQLVKAEKTGTEWKIVQPLTTDADANVIETILATFSGLTIERTLAMTDALKNASGVAQPETVLEIQLNDGTLHKLALGKKDPTETSAYAQIDNNNTIALLTASVLTEAAKSLAELRSKAVTSIAATSLISVRLKNASGTLVAEKSGTAKWVLIEPAAQKDKEADASKLLAGARLAAVEVIDAPDAKIQALLAKPVIEAEFKTTDAKVIKIACSATDGEHAYIKVDAKNEVYKITKADFETLNVKVTDVLSTAAPNEAAAQSETKN